MKTLLISVALSMLVSYSCVRYFSLQAGLNSEPRDRAKSLDLSAENIAALPIEQAGSPLIDKLNQLSAQQVQLTSQIAGLQSQLDLLESVANRSSSGELNNDSESDPLAADLSESQLLQQSQQHNAEMLQQLEQQFYEQAYDPQWAGEMQSSLLEVEKRLQQFDFADVYVAQQDCRSSICRVEFELGDTNAEIPMVLLAADAGSEVVMSSQASQDGASPGRAVVYYSR